MSADLDAQTAALLARLGPGEGGVPDAAELAEMRTPWPSDDPALLSPRRLPAIADAFVPGDPAVPVRIYVPRAPGPRPGLVWLHPGGFVAGRVEDIDGVCSALAEDGGCVVVSVAYRLAPEHPFPAPLDDTLTVVRWLAGHGAALGVDPERLAVGGQSAGATIAAGCALRLRDEDGVPPLRLQVLAYPVLDPRVDAPSYVENAEGFFFGPERTAWSWRQYLADRFDDPPADATPLYADDVRGVAPALLLAAGRDPARDDSRRYRDKLAADGVPARLVEYPRTIHAFLSFAGVLDVAVEALGLIAATLRERLGGARPWLQHVTLPYSRGSAAEVRRFYGEELELPLAPVPDAFAGRDFIWFATGDPAVELHLIPEDAIDRRSERHACLATARLDETVARLRERGHEVERYDVIPGRPQAFVRDPCGNWLELTAAR